MCEADLSSADQVVIFKGDFACLQAINLTAFTTGDLVFMGGKKFLPVGVSSQPNVVRWNSLMFMHWTSKPQNYLIEELIKESLISDFRAPSFYSLKLNIN